MTVKVIIVFGGVFITSEEFTVRVRVMFGWSSYAFTSKREGEGCTGVLVKNSGKMGDNNGESNKKNRCLAVLMERACLVAPSW